MSTDNLKQSAARMPRRPRQHRLEDLSRLAFGSLLPENWSESPRTTDYGIDSDVEIFDGDLATGYRFSVQLKASDATGKKPSVQIKGTSLRYWLSQDVPVLLFYWRASEQKSWFRWAHLIDPSSLVEGRESVTVAFSEEDAWGEGSAIAIADEVRAFRAIRTRSAMLPLPVGVVGSGTVGGVAAGEVVRAFRGFAKEHSKIIDLRPRAADVRVDVSLSGDLIRVGLRGSSPKYLHYGKAVPTTSRIENLDRVESFANDVLFAVAEQVYQAGHAEEAARLVVDAMDRSSIILGAALPQALRILLRADLRDQAAKLLRLARLADEDTSRSELVAALVGHPADASQDDPVVEVFLGWAHEEVSSENFGAAAPLIYNAGYRLIGIDPVRASKVLREASDVDPAYLQRGYWWGDLGGALFLAGEYAESADAYLRAVSLGENAVRLRCGDALMFAGRYSEALEVLEATGEGPEDAEYRLKYRYLSRLVAEYGVVRQERDDFYAERICDAQILTREIAESALEYDLLCPMALWRLAFGSEGRVDEEDVDVDFVLAATFSDPENARAWFDVLILASEIADMQLQEDIFSCAHRFAAEGVIDRAWEVSPDAAGEIEVAFQAIPTLPDRPRVVRHVSFGSPQYEGVSIEQD